MSTGIRLNAIITKDEAIVLIKAIRNYNELLATQGFIARNEDRKVISAKLTSINTLLKKLTTSVLNQ